MGIVSWGRTPPLCQGLCQTVLLNSYLTVTVPVLGDFAQLYDVLVLLYRRAQMTLSDQNKVKITLNALHLYCIVFYKDKFHFTKEYESYYVPLMTHSDYC